MKFKIWLETSANLTSWIDHKGNLYPIGLGSHAAKAIEIMKDNDGLNILINKGWGRVTYIGGDLYFHNPYYKPNTYQLSELINLAIENGFKNIIWDTEGKDIIVWNNNDV